MNTGPLTASANVYDFYFNPPAPGPLSSSGQSPENRRCSPLPTPQRPMNNPPTPQENPPPLPSPSPFVVPNGGGPTPSPRISIVTPSPVPVTPREPTPMGAAPSSTGSLMHRLSSPTPRMDTSSPNSSMVRTSPINPFLKAFTRTPHGIVSPAQDVSVFHP